MMRQQHFFRRAFDWKQVNQQVNQKLNKTASKITEQTTTRTETNKITFKHYERLCSVFSK